MKKLILSLLLLLPSTSFADTATTGNPKLILVSTGSVDRTRSWGDKVNENFSIISASMSTLFSGGVGGGSQSSFAGSKATSAVEMGGFGINNSSGLTLGTGGKITFPDGTTQNTASVGGGGGDQSSFAGSIATGTINFNNNDLINGATAYFKTVYVSSGNLGSPSFAFIGSTMTGIYYDPSGGGTINFVKSSLDAPVSVFSYDTSNLSMATGKSMQSSSYKFQNNNTSRITGANADSSVGIAFEPRGAVPASAFTDLTNRWGFYGATLPFYGAVNISSSQRSVGMTYLTVSSAPNYSGVFYQLTDSSMNVRVPVFMSSVTIGILENPVPSLTIIGGTAGTDLLRMKRPQGTGSEFGWSLAGGCLAFNDVTAGFIITNICGDSSLNELYLGQRGRTAATTRASVLSAETYNTIAGADIPSNNLTLRAGLGTGNGRPGNIAIQTGNLQASGSTVQSASTRVIVTGGEGNVGINIGSPQYKLHVVGDMAVSSISVSGTYTSTSGFIVGNSTITGNLHTTGKIVKRVVTVADGASITPNIDTSDWVYQSNTQAAGTLTINAPTGSPSDGQSLGIRIKNSNIQTYSFNGIYRDPTGIALPTATTGSGATNYLGFIYNLPDNKWDLTGSK